MLAKILSPLTTASSLGVSLRYLSTIAGTVLTILGLFGLLTPEQVAELTRQVPELISALGALIAVAVPAYAVLTKSSSDKAATAAKAIDRDVPFDQPVRIKTPAGSPDIVVTPEGRALGG
jgi:hypothetical protein